MCVCSFIRTRCVVVVRDEGSSWAIEREKRCCSNEMRNHSSKSKQEWACGGIMQPEKRSFADSGANRELSAHFVTSGCCRLSALLSLLAHAREDTRRSVGRSILWSIVGMCVYPGRFRSTTCNLCPRIPIRTHFWRPPSSRSLSSYHSNIHRANYIATFRCQ